MASCSGVTVSSFWPMADMAGKDCPSSSGKLLATTGSGMVRSGLLKPYFSASAFSAAEPSCMPMLANAVLHDSVNAVSMVAVPLPIVPQASPSLLISLVLLCGRVRLVGASTTELGELLPWPNRVELVMILKVDPGG